MRSVETKSRHQLSPLAPAAVSALRSIRCDEAVRTAIALRAYGSRY
jgi:hypothetical protein